MVALSLHYASLDQERGVQMVKNRESERDRGDTADATVNSTTDATANATTGVQKKQFATTSTTSQARQGYIFLGPAGSLPSVYGTILSGG
jgi:hypothetical protein